MKSKTAIQKVFKKFVEQLNFFPHIWEIEAELNELVGLNFSSSDVYDIKKSLEKEVFVVRAGGEIKSPQHNNDLPNLCESHFNHSQKQLEEEKGKSFFQ